MSPSAIITGIGVDIVEIDRIAGTLARYGERFERKIFTEREIAYCRLTPSRTAERYAARFAARDHLRDKRREDAGLLESLAHGTAFADFERGDVNRFAHDPVAERMARGFHGRKCGRAAGN